MSHIKYVVSRFENRSGVVSWRVSGNFNGIRVRRNFRRREDAAAEKAVLEIQALQATSGLHTVVTALTQERVREAEALFYRMDGKTRPLSFYVDYALANYREPDQQKPLEQGIAEYIASKERELAQDQLSMPMLRRIRIDLNRLLRHSPKKLVSDLTVPHLITVLEVGRPGLKTHNNRRGIISTFLKFAFQRGWIAENPIARIPHFRVRRKRSVAETLTAQQARELMEYFETFEGGLWVPYFALCLFAGIRPSVPFGEITRLKPADINLETGIINVSANVSKVREPRKINIAPNLAAWLRAYPLDKFPIVGPAFKDRRAKFKKQFNLTHVVLRHTFISMFVGKFRSIGEAAIQAGNSESIIRRHYLDLKSVAEAEAFYGILPKYSHNKNDTVSSISPAA